MRNSICQFTLFIPLKKLKPRVIRAQNIAKKDDPTIEKIAKNLSSDSKPNENDYDEKSLPLYRRILIKGKGVTNFGKSVMKKHQPCIMNLHTELGMQTLTEFS